MMEVSANIMVVIILPYLNVLNEHLVYFKLTQRYLFFNSLFFIVYFPLPFSPLPLPPIPSPMLCYLYLNKAREEMGKRLECTFLQGR